jgi:hypothetical protein
MLVGFRAAIPFGARLATLLDRSVSGRTVIPAGDNYGSRYGFNEEVSSLSVDKLANSRETVDWRRGAGANSLVRDTDLPTTERHPCAAIP